MAMQGKLVEQRPEEGTGEELYQQIQKEKQKLIKEGKIKKVKPLPEITEEEVPFEIPESWKWVRLNNICNKIVDGTHHSPPNSNNGDYLYITAKNIKEKGIDLSDVTYVTSSIHKEIYSRCNPEKNDVLLIKDGATTGITTVNNISEEFSMLSSVALLKISSMIEPWYIVYILRSEIFHRTIRRQMKGTGITRITLQQIAPMFIPLPPLAEQKRIVAKIEEIMPFIDRYAVAYDHLQSYNTRFPDDLKKSILQMAIQGKLVPQDPNDEPASVLLEKIAKEKQKLIKEGKIKKQKPLPEITEEEIPFDIPESWEWARLTELGCFSSGKTPDMTRKEYWENGTVNWFTSKDMKKKYLDQSILRITEKAAEDLKEYHPGTILMVVRSGILKRMLPICIMTRSGTINQDIKAFELFENAMSDYIYSMLKALEPSILLNYTKRVTTVDSLKFDEFSRQMLVPVPPLAEQKRIVAKLDELLPQIDELK